ncbi:MAG: hypothetical protein LIP00_13320, partial [Parabacteroides sp.]|nr:hypothetical protein [Parabacteroides sp.]
MKHTLIFILLFINNINNLHADNETDSLLSVLDKTIAARASYVHDKENRISELKKKKQKQKNLEAIYLLNREIINQYESFVCDSAELYIHENTELCNRLRLDALPAPLQTQYCWSKIRYYENLMKYTDDPKYNVVYEQKKEAYRDTVMLTLDRNSRDYQKEKAFKLELAGEYEEALRILYPIFESRRPDEHFYAMEAMGLSVVVYGLCKDTEAEKKYMIIAAIADTRLSVKENEALLTLATRLYEERDVN